jgi:signal transduction histidine kinase
VVPRWLQKSWQAFQASADPDELASQSSPLSVLLGPGSLIGILACLAYVPPLARVTELRNVHWSSLLIACGGCLTILAWSRNCRGTIGTLATLFDNTFYSAGLALAAASCREGVGIALAVVHGLIYATIQGRVYALTGLFATTMAMPILAVLIVVRPTLPVAVVLISSVVLMLAIMNTTRTARLERQRSLRLGQALGAADRLADESVQAALTTTLLTLGHFLHELRNYQTAIAVNLEFVSMQPELESASRSALCEAQEAQRAQTALVRETIESLRGRARQETTAFRLTEALKGMEGERRSCGFHVSSEIEFELQGNAEHLRVVMINLIRNAEQAGARNIHCVLRVEPSGTAVQLMVHDDGSGIPESQRGALFESFATSTKPGGSGLGLYLVRRHTELLGGRIGATTGPLGGAGFVLSLPGRVVGPTEPPVKLATETPAERATERLANVKRM